MKNSNGYFWKMLLFVAAATLPVAIVAFWLQSHDHLNQNYVWLLIGAAALPAVFLYNRIVREIHAVAIRMEKAAQSPELKVEEQFTSRAGLLPVDELLLTMQHYRRVLRHLLEEAQSRQDDAILLFDMLPDPIFVLDKKRRIRQTNAAAKVFFNTETMEGDLTAYIRHPSLLKAVEASFRGEGNSERIEFAIPDAVLRHVAAYVVNLDEEDDIESRLIVTLHDVTASKRLEQMRVDFVANASHELRTPLAILIGALETLMGPARDDLRAHQRFLAMMEAQSTRMSQLIDDLLSLSQIEVNEHSRPSGQVNLTEVIQNVTGLIRTRACDMGKSIRLVVPDGPVHVTADADQLTQVFTNLVDNGLKYSRGNSEIDVVVTLNGKDAIVAVTDKGEGIDASHLPRLTERFYRVDSDRSRQLGGTGLGLAIVKHIVSRHRGQLDITSTVGEGSTFTVRLPLRV
ncbi:MAG: hypothetical protein COB93_10635 [Sneathiella sp.]|nr:MAG: hypothetical protein COB93_10635 [Sneathiella sp.]